MEIQNDTKIENNFLAICAYMLLAIWKEKLFIHCHLSYGICSDKDTVFVFILNLDLYLLLNMP